MFECKGIWLPVRTEFYDYSPLFGMFWYYIESTPHLCVTCASKLNLKPYNNLHLISYFSRNSVWRLCTTYKISAKVLLVILIIIFLSFSLCTKHIVCKFFGFFPSLSLSLYIYIYIYASVRKVFVFTSLHCIIVLFYLLFLIYVFNMFSKIFPCTYAHY